MFLLFGRKGWVNNTIDRLLPGDLQIYATFHRDCEEMSNDASRSSSRFPQVVLSSVSPFFKTLLLENPCRHPIVILPSGIDFRDLETIVEFVYGGEVEVPEARLDSVLRAAEQLQIEGMLPRDNNGDKNLDMEVEAR